MVEFIEGIMILLIPLLIVAILLFKWRKDCQRTKKFLVLYDKKTKYWLPVFIVLLTILIIAISGDYSEPIKIKMEEWKPWGWYG